MRYHLNIYYQNLTFQQGHQDSIYTIAQVTEEIILLTTQQNCKNYQMNAIEIK